MDAGFSHTEPHTQPRLERERDSTDIVSHLNDVGGIVKKVIKSGRKIFHSIVFPENSAVATFMDSNPVVTKVYFSTQLFAFMTFFRAVPKIKKSIKKIVKGEGLERYDGAVKIIAHVGKCLGAVETIIGGLEAFEVGKKLGEWGLQAAEKVFNASTGLLEMLGIVSAFMSIASLVHKGFTLHEMISFSKDLKAQPWYKKKGAYSEEDLDRFRNYCFKNAKSLGDHLDLDKEAFKRALKCDFSSKNAAKEDLEQMRHAVAGIAGRLKLRKRVCTVSLITKALDTATIACIFIPALEPFALLLVCATGVAKIALKIFDNINQYKLEDSLGIIDRPSPKTWGATVLDFAKWEIGWYSKAPVGSRLLNSSVLVGNGLSKQISLAGDILVAAGVIFSKISR